MDDRMTEWDFHLIHALTHQPFPWTPTVLITMGRRILPEPPKEQKRKTFFRVFFLVSPRKRLWSWFSNFATYLYYPPIERQHPYGRVWTLCPYVHHQLNVSSEIDHNWKLRFDGLSMYSCLGPSISSIFNTMLCASIICAAHERSIFFVSAICVSTPRQA
jgi:hypothetical protein